MYLGVACFVALLIILFCLAPMPDADMHLQEEDIAGEDTGSFRKQCNLFLGVWSQFCYVGAQVAVANCLRVTSSLRSIAHPLEY